VKPKKWLGRILCILLFAGVLLAICSTEVNAAESVDLETLTKEAARNFATKEGRSYFERFEKAIMPVFREALETCGRNTPDTQEPVDFVFVIAADGTVKRLLYSSDVPFGASVGAKLEAIKTVPPPPHDTWVVALGAANHQHTDTPKALATASALAEYDKAIAPYIAEARATYPAAKKRFLAGLPRGNTFSVRLPLVDAGGKREDSFVTVESIMDGEITGTIASDLNLITEFKQGQRITFPESKIDNWVIVRPDGSEEGNPVGKFLDSYKPK
jgi:hypothetical protein